MKAKVGFVATLGLLGACDGSDSLPPSLDPGVEAYLGVGSVSITSHGPGVAHYDAMNPSEPWAVQLLRIELSRCDLGLQVLDAPAGDGAANGRSTVSELAGASGETLVAAVNGDFFTPEGVPLGTEIVLGDARRIRRRPTLAWSPGSDPWIGIPEAAGGEGLAVMEDAIADGEALATEAVGGFPLLLLDGVRVGDLEVSERPSFAAERHPRTAVGFDQENDVLWILVVDGRQPDHSLGMTLPELTELLELLGVEDAINLDGGGSSAMVAGGSTLNRPSDAEGERPVGNALAVRRDPTLCGVRE